MLNKTLIISLGGSLIVPKEIDLNFLRRFRAIILRFVRGGNRAVIVCGGGSLTRVYQSAARNLTKRILYRDLDWIGIHLTRVNAQLVRSMFGQHAYKKIIKEPQKVLQVSEKIIIVAGWKPGWSTDFVATECARHLQASEIINLSNVNYIYDKDPKYFDHARPFTHISWSEMKNIVGSRWEPGAHLPFDPIATRLAARLDLKVIFLSGKNLRSLVRYFQTGKVDGSSIGQES